VLAIADEEDRMGEMMTPLALDLTSPEVRANPFPFYAEVRERGAVLAQGDGAWFVTRFAEVWSSLRDPRQGAGLALRPFPWMVGHEELELTRLLNRFLVFVDGPFHRRLRSLVNMAFTPSAVAKMERYCTELVDDLIAKVEDLGDFELIADYAHVLPSSVICRMLDLPPTSWEWCSEVMEGAGRLLEADISDEEVLRMNDAAVEFAAFLGELMEQRRTEPGDDLLSAMVHADIDGDRFTDEEIVANAFLFHNAGQDTTVNLTANAIIDLLARPDQASKLRDDPALDKPATEELLRFDGPLQFSLGHVVFEPMEVAGVELQAGDTLMAGIGCGNRDPRAFDQPEELIVDRFVPTAGRPAPKHLSFGGGAHFCLGATLARLEASIAIPALLRAFPDLELTEEPTYLQIVNRGPTGVQLRTRPVAPRRVG
jgi:cytochrome P450